MKPRPITVTNTNGTSTPAKRTLFRIALTVTMIGTIAVSTILILQSGFALSHLRYFIDIGQYPLHITSALLLLLGLVSLTAFIILTIGLAKVKKTLAVIAAVLLGICSLCLIAFSIWSFVTISSEQLSTSIKSTIIKELDQTQFSGNPGNIIVDNTQIMRRIEKQHHCCGDTKPIDDYRSRHQSMSGSSNPSSPSGSGSARGRTSTQQNTGTFGSPLLPISCCNEKYLSADDTCDDMFGNNTSPINRYYTKGCFDVVVLHKYERIKKQGFTTIVAACLAVISCIALAAVVRLLGEGYQIVPLRAAT